MTDSNATVHDPVCHTNIDIRDAAGRSDHEGLTYYFCTPACKLTFDTDPERVLKSEAEFDHDRLHIEMAQGISATAAAEAVAEEEGPPSGEEGNQTREVIAARAFELYLMRGSEHGHDVEDWLKAESELRGDQA
jgi:YHS domain-containing protein